MRDLVRIAVLLTDVKDGESAGAVAERIVQTLAQPVTFAGHEVRVTPSVGIAVYPQDGDRPEILLKNADTAMYSAKRAGKNHYRFYDESMNEAALERTADAT